MHTRRRAVAALLAAGAYAAPVVVTKGSNAGYLYFPGSSGPNGGDPNGTGGTGMTIDAMQLATTICAKTPGVVTPPTGFTKGYVQVILVGGGGGGGGGAASAVSLYGTGMPGQIGGATTISYPTFGSATAAGGGGGGGGSASHYPVIGAAGAGGSTGGGAGAGPGGPGLSEGGGGGGGAYGGTGGTSQKQAYPPTVGTAAPNGVPSDAALSKCAASAVNGAAGTASSDGYKAFAIGGGGLGGTAPGGGGGGGGGAVKSSEGASGGGGGGGGEVKRIAFAFDAAQVLTVTRVGEGGAGGAGLRAGSYDWAESGAGGAGAPGVAIITFIPLK